MSKRFPDAGGSPGSVGGSPGSGVIVARSALDARGGNNRYPDARSGAVRVTEKRAEEQVCTTPASLLSMKTRPGGASPAAHCVRMCRRH
ncbi:hypothetical protein MTO96_001505 [Rhipicephalus appendiculatus]